MEMRQYGINLCASSGETQTDLSISAGSTWTEPDPIMVAAKTKKISCVRQRRSVTATRGPISTLIPPSSSASRAAASASVSPASTNPPGKDQLPLVCSTTRIFPFSGSNTRTYATSIRSPSAVKVLLLPICPSQFGGCLMNTVHPRIRYGAGAVPVEGSNHRSRFDKLTTNGFGDSSNTL